ncbi:two component transcriptional regulator, LytTR family [Algoriphagus faecimaris]|uniref:Two component transcriptional regulator, LytTR family n=1 Tax=Algoriphagus faecimaris TaxID=686796 RepID=A0A1G6NAR1_9BACT|nr:LytTR family DNA-binding domain-containing protein [Algoriphagus faecimaris]SDC64477.1 two component transcriptional regulator, LytTR family [Algoriphagus faecimaris]
MELINYVILDDEPIAHRIIEGYCENFSFLNKVGNFYNGFEALEFFRKGKADLIFLDINMPKLTGFEMLKSISDPPKVIVTSAHQEFAVEGYELDITDYLLKPFGLDRFIKAINKLRVGERKTNEHSDVEYPGRIFLKSDKKYVQLELNDIFYVQALGNYTKVFHSQGMLICPDKISDLEAKLPSPGFIRVHKSYLINRDRIEFVEGNQIKVAEVMIPIGQTYKTRLQGFLN